MEVHRCRFVEFNPEAISAIAVSPSLGALPYMAVARSQGDIELWNIAHSYHLERRIPGTQGVSVEALLWIRSSEGDNDSQATRARSDLYQQSADVTAARLFSAGLDGVVVEWNLNTLKPKRTVDSYGGAIWCMAVNKAGTHIAAGCEDGGVRLFSVSGNTLEYTKTFMRQEQRILSIAWHPSGDYLVTGSVDSTIRRYETKQGRPILKITVEGRNTMIWAVQFLKDGTIVSGDSLGHTQFWDSVTGTLLQSFAPHQADVLCLAVNEDQTRIFASGVDHKLVQFRQLEVSANAANGDGVRRKWVMTGGRRLHTHDVRALAVFGDVSKRGEFLVAGGVDTNLVVLPLSRDEDSFIAAKARRVPPFQRSCFTHLAQKARLLLVQFSTNLKLWRLGTAVAQSSPLSELPEHTKLTIDHEHSMLLDMKPKFVHNICASAISSDGSLIACSDGYETKLFRLKFGNKVVVKKLGCLPSSVSGAHQLLFTHNGKRLIVASSDNSILVIDLLQGGEDNEQITATISAKFTSHQPNREPEASPGSTIISLVVDEKDKWLASGDLLNRMFVFNLEELKQHHQLPRFSNQLTTLAFMPGTNTLVLPMASNSIFLFDVKERTLTDWSRKFSNSLPGWWMRRYDKILGVAFNSARPSVMTVWSSGYLCQIDLKKPVSEVQNGTWKRSGKGAQLVYLPPKNKRKGESKGKADGSKSAQKKATVSGQDSGSSNAMEIDEDVDADEDMDLADDDDDNDDDNDDDDDDDDNDEDEDNKNKKKEKGSRTTGGTRTKSKKNSSKAYDNTASGGDADEDGDGNDTETEEKIRFKRRSKELERAASAKNSQLSNGGRIVLSKQQQSVPTSGSQQQQSDINFYMVRRYRLLLLADYIGPNHLVVVERPWLAVLESMPPTFNRKKYGAM